MIKTDNSSKEEQCADDFVSRRFFLKGLTYGAAVAVTGIPGIANATKDWLKTPRKLAFYNLHTNEKLQLTYFEKGQYISEAMQEINYLLRDHRSSDIYSMDPNLLDLLADLQNMLGGNKVFNVISAYRSPSTNAMLNKKSNSVATKSLHMQGKAIDIRIDDVDSKVIQKASIALMRGGVGYYRQSDFVHIDTGRVRSW